MQVGTIIKLRDRNNFGISRHKIVKVLANNDSTGPVVYLECDESDRQARAMSLLILHPKSFAHKGGWCFAQTLASHRDLNPASRDDRSIGCWDYQVDRSM